MEGRSGAALGAGVVGTMVALAAVVEQGLLWLVLFLGSFFFYGVWFWRRVFHQRDDFDGSEAKRQLRSSRSTRKLRSPLERQGATKELTPERAAANATAAATSADAGEADPADSAYLRHRREGNGGTCATGQENECSDGLRSSSDRRDLDVPREGEAWDEVGFDSADEADSEAEQDSLLPAAEHRRRLPRRMSFPSFNLAAGCFPPEAHVQHYIVSACMYTPKLPPTKAVLQLIESRLLNFQRLRQDTSCAFATVLLWLLLLLLPPMLVS